MGSKNKNRTKIIGAAAAAGAALGYTAVCNQLFDFTVARKSLWSYGGKKKKDGKAKAAPLDRYGRIPEQDQEWLKNREQDELEICSTVDDTPLFGRYLRCENPKRIILCAHGYRTNSLKDFAGVARWLHENNCDLLTIDQRGCGKSGGEYITFGAREKYDVLDWLDFIESHNRKGLPVYLYGVSMGASTVSCASGLTLPPNVRGMIADCGYTSMKDICTLCLKKWFHLPAFPFMQSFGRRCQRKAHFGMQEADAEHALRKCRIPSLFIHGTADKFVPPSHAIRNYQACGAADKDILWIDGAEHAASYYENPAEYRSALKAFFDRTEHRKPRETEA